MLESVLPMSSSRSFIVSGVVVSLVLVVCGYCSSFALNLDPTAVCKMTGGILQCSEHLG